MKIWVDDVRPAPESYDISLKTVNDAKNFISGHELRQKFMSCEPIELIDLDHDAGDYARFGGGDYIKLLDWLEETGRNYPIRIHSMNPVGHENMRRIIEKNGWKEIY